MDNNTMVRLAARGAGVPLWKLAMRLGISEATMTRTLRKPLSEERKELFLDVIEHIRKEEEK